MSLGHIERNKDEDMGFAAASGEMKWCLRTSYIHGRPRIEHLTPTIQTDVESDTFVSLGFAGRVPHSWSFISLSRVPSPSKIAKTVRVR